MSQPSRRAYLAGCIAAIGSATGCVTVSRPPGTVSTRTDRSTGGEPAAADPGPFEYPTDHCEVEDAIRGDDPLTVEFDSRARFRCTGQLLDGMEDLKAWGTYEGERYRDQDRFTVGSQSMRLETTGGRVWAYRRFEPGLDLSERDLSVAIHPGEGDSKASMLRVQLLAPDYQNRIDMRHGVGKLGGWFRMDLGPTVVKSHPDLTDVREIRIQSMSGSQPRLRLNVDEIRLVPKADTGRVIISFDDIPISQYENAFPVMQEFGYPGVAGAIPWLTSDPDFVSTAGLHEMQDAGWDVVSHPQLTDPPKPLPTLDPSAQHDAIRRSKRWLVENGFGEGASFVIWPFHAAGPTTLEIASRYHHLGFAGGRSPSGIPSTDPLTIGRVDGASVDDTLRMLSFAESYNQLVVVMYHEVGTGALSTADFERTLRAIERSDLEVLTASGLWKEMGG